MAPLAPAHLALLTHHRYALPALAQLHIQRGSKHVTLVHRLGAHRLAVSQALDTLIELGLALPNPGYGHPMRPEYILTERGHTLGPACVHVSATLVRFGLADFGLRKWTLPTILAVHQGAERFGDIRAALASATDRAVSQCLNGAGDASILCRADHAKDARAVVYRLERIGRSIAHATSELPALG